MIPTSKMYLPKCNVIINSLQCSISSLFCKTDVISVPGQTIFLLVSAPACRLVFQKYISTLSANHHSSVNSSASSLSHDVLSIKCRPSLFKCLRFLQSLVTVHAFPYTVHTLLGYRCIFFLLFDYQAQYQSTEMQFHH